MPTRASQLKQISPWIPLLGLTTLWHAFRGAPGDAVIYGVLTILLIVDTFGSDKVSPKYKSKITRRPMIFLGIVFVLVTAIAPRFWLGTAVVMIVIGIYALHYMWFQGPTIVTSPKSPQLKLAGNLWLLVIFPLMLVECFAFIQEEGALTDFESPTITVLLDPYLANSFGRGIFAALWVWCGFTLVRKRPLSLGEVS